MVTRRDMGVSFAPAKRAAVWPRPSREPGRWPACWPLPPATGRRTADLPPLALPACLSTLETKLWPWPLPRFFGRARAHPEIVVAAVGHGCAPQAPACPGVRSTRTCLHWRGPRAPRGTAAKPLRAAPPHVQTGFRRGPVSRLAFRLCPSLPLRASAARRRCCTSSQRAGEHANGRRPGAFEARRLHVGRLRRRQREVRCECTRTARATTRRRTVERHARWHDERRGKVQRIGGHHGRVSSQTGCATPITADALTGPK
jgi:hypothetical protein